jgi:hypothetical protein
MEIPNELFSQDFWLELRKQTSARRVVGAETAGYCTLWSFESYHLLKKMGLSDLFKVVRLETNNGRDCHDWLELRKGKERIFLADGTAGQFFPECTLGLYTHVEQIPEPMKNFYNSKTWSRVPSEDLRMSNIRERFAGYSPVLFK